MQKSSVKSHQSLVISRKYAVLPLLLLLILLAGCGGGTPTATSAPTLVPSETPDIQGAVNATLTALAPTTAAMVAAAEATFTPSPEVTAEGTAEATAIVVPDPLLGESIDPPLDITLPEGWALRENDTLLLADLSSTEDLRGLPFVAWRGPVTGGTGTIVMLWGFPSLVPVTGDNAMSAVSGTPPPADLFADGLRLLRLAILDSTCNIGTDLRRSYRIGNLSAVGTQFAAVECPELPDTRGWFAGVQSGGLSFVFYVYALPIESMDVASNELQAILDTIQFRVPDAPTATPGS